MKRFLIAFCVQVNEYQKKEEEWEAKYSEMASSAPAPASPQPSTPAHKMEVEEQKVSVDGNIEYSVVG